MKRISVVSVPLAVAAIFVAQSLAAGSVHADRVNRRQHRQGARIAEGVKSGELTRDEAKKLRREERKIRRTEHRMRKDGELSPAEKAKLEGMQDKASKDIHELKHNEDKRPEVPAPGTGQPQQ